MIPKKMVLTTLLKFVASAGSTTVINNIIRATTPKSLTVMNKVMVGVGEFFLSAMIGDAVSNYVEEQVKDFFKEEPKKEVELPKI
jgi:hypothetical protein